MQEQKETTSLFFLPFFRRWKKIRDRFALALNVNEERKVEIYIGLSKAATLTDLAYWLQILFSAGIATLGLILSSPAVIIGAMLISPLMNPILSFGLALATGDLVLGVRSLFNLFLSTFASVAVAFLLVALLPFKEMTEEIAARTSPNTLDLGIALFSGVIGAVATCRDIKGVVTSIPGVAIAVALMPPLCVVGYGIGVATSQNFTQGMDYAQGGGLLYLTNLVAITFMAMLIFMLLRIETPLVRQKIREWRDKDSESNLFLRGIQKIPTLEKAREIRSVTLRLLMVLIPLLLIVIPLTQSFSKLKADYEQKQKENVIQQKAQQLWEKYYSNDNNGESRSYLDKITVAEKKGKLEIYLRVFDNLPYTPVEKNEYVRMLASHLNRPAETINLQMVEVPLSARENLQPQETEVFKTIEEIQAIFLENLKTALADFKLPPPASLIDYRMINSPSSAPKIEIYYLSEREIGTDAQLLLTEEVKRKLNLTNIQTSFHRVSAETFDIPFAQNSPEFEPRQGNIWQDLGAVLQHYPQLKLALTLKPNSSENQDIYERKQAAVKEYLVQNWSIQENRIIFTEGEGDRFRLILTE